MEGSEAPIGDRFTVVELLKTGLGVWTHRGIDTITGLPVIIKIVSTAGVPTAVRLRLEHEAAVLQRLDLATGPPLLASGHHDRRFYLVQPLLEGISLADRLVGGPLPVTSAIDVAIAVLRVLEMAHEQGVYHRDVKPANVIIRERDGTTGADLVDFGLACSCSLDVSLRDEPVGTARYLAPETLSPSWRRRAPSPIRARQWRASSGMRPMSSSARH